jgi:mRNA interferase MazF
MVTRLSQVATLKRGSLIKVSFDPTLGHEQAGYRPALVLSDQGFHKATGFAFCVPITSKQKGLLFEIEVKGKYIQGVALPHGARMLDLHQRDFVSIEMASKDVLNKAQVILHKIITEKSDT